MVLASFNGSSIKILGKSTYQEVSETEVTTSAATSARRNRLSSRRPDRPGVGAHGTERGQGEVCAIAHDLWLRLDIVSEDRAECVMGDTMNAAKRLVIAALALSLPVPGHAVVYTITDLGIVELNSGAYAINNAGEIAGATYPTGCCNGLATVWNGSTATHLGPPPGMTGSSGQSINSSGQVAGYSFSATSQAATVWNGVTPTALQNLPGTNFGNAVAINNSGQVAGASYVSGPASPFATVWNGTTATALPGLAGTTYSSAFGINSTGQVVGASYTSGGTALGTLWTGSAPTALGLLAGATSNTGLSINASGVVAGYSTGSAGNMIATVWSGLVPTGLGTLPGGTNSVAYAINSLGEVVGSSDDGTGDVLASVWNGLSVADLGALPGGTTSVARGINDLGQIAGYSDDGNGEEHAVLWSVTADVPEPSTWAMMIIGFIGVGLMASRRKSKLARERCLKPLSTV